MASVGEVSVIFLVVFVGLAKHVARRKAPGECRQTAGPPQRVRMVLRAILEIPWKPMKIVFYYVVIDREKTRGELARLAGGRRTLRFRDFDPRFWRFRA